jgi:uncharacterized protein (UPF0276 family)
VIALAVADSPLARKLLADGTLEINYLETSGHLADTAVDQFPQQPLLLHNSVYDWSLGHSAALDQKNVVPCTLRSLARTRAPWLSVHLGFSAADVAFRERWMQPQSPTLSRGELLGRICDNIRALAATVSVPLFLENLNYYPNGAYEHVCEPDFIAAVLVETGVGMLLDIAHARVSAAQLGGTIEDYLARLPLARVRQLHVGGPRWREGRLQDVHEPLLEEDYALLRYVLRSVEPLALTLEYGREESALREQLDRLGAIVDGVG